MNCRLHKPRVVRVRGRLVTMYCESCRCTQWFETDEKVSVGDRFRWRDVA